MKQWLKDAVFYEIYPQSFYDTNGDGIGDLQGIIAKLDYIRDLGCNALWINPCFDSPFKDAGYDVRDYKKIAPRYGTNEDAAALFKAAHEKGIRVLFDLVPGHTSEEHPWFKASCKPGHNEYSDRFIWTDSCFASGDGMPFIGGETERNGTYILNFFKCQPALNYGYGKINQKWQKPTDDPACVATVEAMKDVMRFWLDMGCDGFRVDMASSLVKNDTKNKKHTCKIWRNIRDMLDVEYPEAALIAEWNGPRMSLKNGFDMDFYLNWQGNGYSWLMRNYDGAMDSNPHNIGKAYFCKNSGTGIDKFLDEYLPAYKATHKDGLWCFITCNHDTIRPSAGLTTDELRLAYATIFTLPGAPFVYYGDEIGMRYLPLPTKEGGYFRTGSRTPMQWDDTANHGFSTADAQDIYLPVDTAADAPTVAAQADDPDSLLNSVKSLLAFRHAHADLNADAPFKVLYAPKAKDDYRPFVWQRGDLICAVNPAGVSIELPLELAEDVHDRLVQELAQQQKQNQNVDDCIQKVQIQSQHSSCLRYQPRNRMMSRATTKPKIAVPSARAAPSSRLVWILPEASGWRLMASVALPVAMPMPMPPPMPVSAAIPAPRATSPFIIISPFNRSIYSSPPILSFMNSEVRKTKT